jgi:hypothetical protein
MGVDCMIKSTILEYFEKPLFLSFLPVIEFSGAKEAGSGQSFPRAMRLFILW